MTFTLVDLHASIFGNNMKVWRHTVEKHCCYVYLIYNKLIFNPNFFCSNFFFFNSMQHRNAKVFWCIRSIIICNSLPSYHPSHYAQWEMNQITERPIDFYRRLWRHWGETHGGSVCDVEDETSDDCEIGGIQLICDSFCTT